MLPPQIRIRVESHEKRWISSGAEARLRRRRFPAGNGLHDTMKSPEWKQMKIPGLKDENRRLKNTVMKTAG